MRLREDHGIVRRAGEFRRIHEQAFGLAERARVRERLDQRRQGADAFARRVARCERVERFARRIRRLVVGGARDVEERFRARGDAAPIRRSEGGSGRAERRDRGALVRAFARRMGERDPTLEHAAPHRVVGRESFQPIEIRASGGVGAEPRGGLFAQEERVDVVRIVRQCERREAQRVVVREHVGGLARGPSRGTRRIAAHLREIVVVREIARAPRSRALEDVRDARVPARADGGVDAIVDRGRDEMVREDEIETIARTRLADETTVEQLVEPGERLARGESRDVADHVDVTSAAADRRDLGDRPGAIAQAVGPRRDHASDGLGARSGGDVARPAFERVGDGLAQKERVALAKGIHAIEQVRVVDRGRREDPGHLVAIETAELDRRNALFRAERVDELAQRVRRRRLFEAVRSDDERARPCDPSGDRRDRVDRRLRGPVEIFEHEQERPRRGDVFDGACDRFEQTRRLAFRRERGELHVRGRREIRQDAREHARRQGRKRARFEDGERRAERFDETLVRRRFGRRRLAAVGPAALALHEPRDLADESRLPDPGLAAEDHDVPEPACGAIPGVTELRALFLATEKREAMRPRRARRRRLVRERRAGADERTVRTDRVAQRERLGHRHEVHLVAQALGETIVFDERARRIARIVA